MSTTATTTPIAEPVINLVEGKRRRPRTSWLAANSVAAAAAIALSVVALASNHDHTAKAAPKTAASVPAVQHTNLRPVTGNDLACRARRTSLPC